MLRKIAIVLPLLAAMFLTPVLSVFNLQVAAQVVYRTSYSQITINVNDVPKPKLFDLTANVLNDYKWYPGIISTTLISAGEDAPIGNIYLQKINLGGGFVVDVQMEVTDYKKNHTYELKGTSPLLNFDAHYEYKPGVSGDSQLILTSRLYAPNLTYESRAAGLMVAYNGIFTYFNTTGNVVIDYLYIVE